MIIVNLKGFFTMEITNKLQTPTGITKTDLINLVQELEKIESQATVYNKRKEEIHKILGIAADHFPSSSSPKENPASKLVNLNLVPLPPNLRKGYLNNSSLAILHVLFESGNVPIGAHDLHKKTSERFPTVPLYIGGISSSLATLYNKGYVIKYLDTSIADYNIYKLSSKGLELFSKETEPLQPSLPVVAVTETITTKVLSILKEFTTANQQISSSELAKILKARFGISAFTTNIASLMNKLKKEGWVDCIKDPSHLHKNFYKFTPSGIQHFSTIPLTPDLKKSIDRKNAVLKEKISKKNTKLISDNTVSILNILYKNKGIPLSAHDIKILLKTHYNLEPLPPVIHSSLTTLRIKNLIKTRKERFCALQFLITEQGQDLFNFLKDSKVVRAPVQESAKDEPQSPSPITEGNKQLSQNKLLSDFRISILGVLFQNKDTTIPARKIGDILKKQYKWAEKISNVHSNLTFLVQQNMAIKKHFTKNNQFFEFAITKKGIDTLHSLVPSMLPKEEPKAEESKEKVKFVRRDVLTPTEVLKVRSFLSPPVPTQESIKPEPVLETSSLPQPTKPTTSLKEPSNLELVDRKFQLTETMIQVLKILQEENGFTSARELSSKLESKYGKKASSNQVASCIYTLRVKEFIDQQFGEIVRLTLYQISENGKRYLKDLDSTTPV